MSDQFLRSGTSISANIAESVYAQSNADLACKLYIARKEANETLRWIEFLSYDNLLSKDIEIELTTKCTELLRILTASIKTLKRK